MTDVIEQFLAAAAAEAPDAAAAEAHVIKPGDPIIGWSSDMDLVWGGPGDGDRRFETTSISFGKPSTLTASVDRVAPKGTPLADRKDPRIQIVHDKGHKTRTKAYWLKGDWCLTLPDVGIDWFKTKTDAVDAAARRLAIADWHAANPQPTT